MPGTSIRYFHESQEKLGTLIKLLIPQEVIYASRKAQCPRGYAQEISVWAHTWQHGVKRFISLVNIMFLKLILAVVYVSMHVYVCMYVFMYDIFLHKYIAILYSFSWKGRFGFVSCFRVL